MVHHKVQLQHVRNSEKLYMSPEIFETLVNREKKIKYNPFKSEVFSLGLIVLECGLG